MPPLHLRARRDHHLGGRTFPIQIGTVREVVARTLRPFASAGLLRMERHRIILLDRAGLEAEAQK